MLWLPSSLALAAQPSSRCETLVSIDTFRARLEEAWTTREQHPADAHELTLKLEQQLACLDTPLTATDAAAFHRLKAVDALYSGDDIGATAAVSAAQRLDGEGAAAWGEQIPAFGVLLASSAGATEREEFGTSLAARVFVDGETTPARTLGQPVIIQIFTPDGAPIDGTWVDGRDDLPDWVIFPPLSCAEGEVPIAALLAEVSRAESAYIALDVAAFESALQTTGEGLPCLSHRIGIAQAAAIHRLEGIRQFTHGAETAALRSFQEAQALDPAYIPADTLLRPGSSLADLWTRAEEATPSPWLAEPLSPPLAMVVDGLAASVRPAALPSIIQLVAPGGLVLWTRYVPPGAALPALAPYVADASSRAAAQLPPALQVYHEIGQQRASRIRDAGFTLSGIALLTTSAAFYVAHTNAAFEYNERETSPLRLQGLQQTANRSATASSLFFIAGSGLLVTSLLR